VLPSIHIQATRDSHNQSTLNPELAQTHDPQKITCPLHENSKCPATDKAFHCWTGPGKDLPVHGSVHPVAAEADLGARSGRADVIQCFSNTYVSLESGSEGHVSSRGHVFIKSVSSKLEIKCPEWAELWRDSCLSSIVKGCPDGIQHGT
jgi:hypothetical protein